MIPQLSETAGDSSAAWASGWSSRQPRERERKRKRCWLLLGGSWWLRTGDRYPDVRAFKRMKPPAPRLAPAATRASPHGACDVYNKRMTARGGGCRLRSPLLVRCVFRVSHAETRAARDFTRLERRALLVGSTRQVKLSSFVVVIVFVSRCFALMHVMEGRCQEET